MMGILSIVGFIFFLLTAWGCNGGDAIDQPLSETGTITFNLAWENPYDQEQNRTTKLAPSGDVCVDYDIGNISVVLANSQDLVVASESWACSEHQGTLETVPAGSGYTLAVTGTTGSGNNNWQSQISDIDVREGDKTDIGSIAMIYVGDDTAPPEITDLRPADGAENVVLAPEVTITFNENVVAASVNTSCGLVRTSTYEPVDCTIHYDAATYTATLTPLISLEPGAWYEVVVSPGIQDLAGLTMATEHQSSFLTRSPAFHGIAVLDSISDVGMYSAIVVTGDTVLITYYDESELRAKVAKSANGGIDWTISTLPGTQSMGLGSAIAVDGSHVFISTTEASRLGVIRSDDNGDTWELVDSGVFASTSNSDFDEFSTSIVLDGSNFYIAYLDNSYLLMNILKASYDGTDASLTTISPPIGDENGYYASMAHLNNTLYVSHSLYNEGDIYFTRMPDSVTDPVNVLVDQINTMSGRGYTSLAVCEVETATHVYIAYFDQGVENSNLKFARSINNGANFSTTTIDNSVDNVGRYPSLALGEDNTIYISYYDAVNGNLKIAISVNEGTTWETFTVDNSTDDVGQFSALAVEGSNVYISYYDTTNKDLKFAKSIDSGNSWN